MSRSVAIAMERRRLVVMSLWKSLRSSLQTGLLAIQSRNGHNPANSGGTGSRDRFSRAISRRYRHGHPGRHLLVHVLVLLLLGRQELRIRWFDGREAVYPAAFLRNRCPCAACRTERERQSRTLLPVLSGAQSQPARAVGGHTVGNYALAIEWSDGHDTGITGPTSN